MSELSRNTYCAVCYKSYKVQNGVCVACRHFFRRSVINKNVYDECKNENTCYLMKTSDEKLLKCKRCRYQKCFDLKMFIISKSTFEKHSSFLRNPSPSRSLPDIILSIESMVNELEQLEISVVKCQHSIFNPLYYPSLDQIINETSKLAEISRRPKMPGWPMTIEIFLQKQKELKMLKEKIEQRRVSPSEWLTVTTKDWLPFNLYIAVENIKSLPIFKKIFNEDRRNLLRGTCFIAVTFSSICFSHAMKCDMIHTPDGVGISEKNSISVIKNILSLEQSNITNMNNGSRILMIVPIREKMTNYELYLLKIIAICNPFLDLSDYGRHLISQERQKYARALFDLCLREHGSNNGPSRYVTLLEYIGLMERHQRYFQDFMVLARLSPSYKTCVYSEQFLKDVMNF